MRPKAYDDTNARVHIKRLLDILEKPPVLTISAYSSKAPEEIPKARVHIKRLLDILEKPPVLTISAYSSKAPEEIPKARTRSASNDIESKQP